MHRLCYNQLSVKQIYITETLNMLKFLSFFKTRNVSVPIRCFVECSKPTFQLDSNLAQHENREHETPKLKRFVKNEKFREKKPLKPNFVENLFCGQFDKDILVYPEVLENEELDSLLKHSFEVENNFIRLLKAKDEITNEVLESLKKVELYGLSVPQKYGGLGYNETETKFIIECLGISPRIGRLLANNESFGINIISKFGNEEQKLRYLPKLATGESLTTFAYLEDCPLVDILSFSTFSIEDSIRNGYVINGSKKWVQNANVSDIFLILTKASLECEEAISINYNVFLADKKTPGITVYEINNEHAKEFSLYNVDFQNIFLPRESLIKADGYTILKEVMTSNNLSCAVLCLSLLKKMAYQAIQINEEKILQKTSLNEHFSVQTNMGFLSTYIYVLESVIYLITGRKDIYDEPDLFLESCVAKILATDILHLVIKKYLQVVGRESFKESSILKEALSVLENYLVLDENSENLKKLIGGEGLKKISNLKFSDIVKLRDPYNNPVKKIKWLFTSDEDIKKKSNLKLKMELHALLQNEADVLELCLAKIKNAIVEHIRRYGKVAENNDHYLNILSEAVVYTYALSACLARSSTAHCNAIESSVSQIYMTKTFASLVNYKVTNNVNQIMTILEGPEIYVKIGEEAFRVKEYPAEHPLTKTY